MKSNIELLGTIQETILSTMNTTSNNNSCKVAGFFAKLDLISEITEKISEVANAQILEEIQHDFYSSILFLTQGFYRYSMIAMRSMLELSIAFIYFTDNNYDYLLWKNNKYDVSFSKLTDVDNGVLTLTYLEIFNNSNSIDMLKIREKALEEYRICSEYVHGKFNYMNSKENPSIKYNEELFSSYEDRVNNIIDIVIIMLNIRFNKELSTMDSPQLNTINQICMKYEV